MGFRRFCSLPLLCVLLVPPAIGCSSSDDGKAPVFAPLSDQVALLDSAFTLELKASDPDGDPLVFDFTSDIKDISNRTELRAAANTAVFAWTPIASDLGIHAFDFTVSDGKHTARQTISIEVRAAVGSSSGPVFRQPAGSGTTLDLGQHDCLEVKVVVEDSDSPEVQLGQEEPPIEGSSFEQLSGQSGAWNWCPSQEQIASSDRYLLKLSADDGQNPKVVKNFLVVLRKPQEQNCPGSAPAIEHSPEDASTLNGLAVIASVSDDKGIKFEPLLYYSTTEPTNPPDVTQMTQTTMFLLEGDMKSGSWGADVPNPVANQPQGSRATLYYLIVVQDNDDTEADCDHLTQAPASGTFKMTVTNPGGQGQLGLCERCTSDVQCGGPSDNCLYMGSGTDSFCFKACSSDSDCPQPQYYCSTVEYASVDGASSRQCLPVSYNCGPASGTCTDDSFEPNDSPQDLQSHPARLSSGQTLHLVSCPSSNIGADDDWFSLQVQSDSLARLVLQGEDSTDLDLALYDSNGVAITKSESLSSSETVSSCITSGTYYARVYSWEKGANNYTLSYTSSATSCSGSCDDDPLENDDNASQARVVDMTAENRFLSDTNALCPDDQDWYRVELFEGETLYVSLMFDQASAQEDLDLLLYHDATLLTPCDEAHPSSCSSAHGQSRDSDESLQWQTDSAGSYYVVVRGWNHSQNLYDICIALNSSTLCPVARAR